MQKTVILDADDTLWQTQVLYDEAREALVSYLSGKGIQADAARAKSKEISAALVKEINPQTGAPYLFTAARFPESFARTLLFFFPDAPSDQVEHARSLGQQIFEKKAKINPHAGGMMNAFRQLGYQVVILTKGEEWVQEKRLAEFDFIRLADAAKIVADKDADTFRALIAQYGIDPAKSFSIGDSLKADIVPAAQAGLNTILFSTNTWDVNKQGDLPAGTKVVTTLSDAVGIVLAHKKATAAPVPQP